MFENMGKYNHKDKKAGSFDDGGYSNGESGVTRLIRTVCKSV